MKNTAVGGGGGGPFANVYPGQILIFSCDQAALQTLMSVRLSVCYIFLAATKQLYVYFLSVCQSLCLCLSVCLSVTHFYPRPVLAFGYCRCLRQSVTKFVRAITHHPFKLGSPNLDHRCKRPWLRSLLFWGVIDLDLQGQI